MKNKSYHQFERNRYFYGKLMTVRDFEAEQKYFNDKRRLANRLLHGPGIVCGLDVVSVDDRTISVEAGIALDYGGREIVVPSPVIRKLSTIDGYSDNEEEKDIYLCIEYDEKGKEPINAVVDSTSYSDEGSEFNRCQETYRLFLKNDLQSRKVNTLSKIIEDVQIIYNDENICISQAVPRYVNPLGEFDIRIVVEKKSDITGISFEYELKSDFFKSKEEGGKIKVVFNEPEKQQKGIYEVKLALLAEEVFNVTGNLEVDQESFRLSAGGKTVKSCMKSKCGIEIIQEPIKDRIRRDYFELTLDKALEENEDDVVCLARIRVLKAGEAYIIQEIHKVPFNQYVYSSPLLSLLSSVESGYGRSEAGIKAVAYPLEISRQPEVSASFNKDTGVFDFKFGIPVPPTSDYVYATGIEAIELGVNAKMNKKFYSGEIEHGLGPGPVYILLGIEENREQSSILEYDSRQVLFGERSVFEKSEYEPDVPEVSLGAIAYTQRGTFRIGVKLLDSTDDAVLKIRWIAFKYNDVTTEKQQYGFRNIDVHIVPDTITVKVREKIKLKAVVSGTGNTECKWSMADAGGGSVDANGVYEAPNTPGVYEVVAVSCEDPQKKASAFIVVKE